MSTQYEFMKRQVIEEVAALQEKLIAIQADCINRIKEIPVTSDLEDTMDELLNMNCLIKSQISSSFRLRNRKVRPS